MNSKFLIPMVTCLVVAGFQAQADTVITRDKDPNTATQLTGLFKKMNIVLSGGKPEKNSMLILANPGHPLPEKLDDNVRSVQKELDLLADALPLAAPMYMPSPGGTLSSLYGKILNNHQTIDTPEPTQAEKNQYEAALKRMDPDSPEMKKYEATRSAYRDALSNAESAESAKIDAEVDKKAADKSGDSEKKKTADRVLREATAKWNAAKQVRNDREKDWRNFGGQKRYDDDSDIISQYEAKSGKAWWATLKSKFDLGKRSDEEDYQAIYSPAPAHWHDEGNNTWTKVTYKYGETIDESKLKSESFHVEAGGSYDWFSISSKNSYLDMSAEKLLKHTDMNITFEVLRVTIYRKWYDAGVLQNRFWTLPKAVTGGVISYGNLADNAKKSPGMPLYVTTLFLARNLKISTHMDKNTVEEYKKKTDSETSLGFGPFSLSGGYHSEDSGKKEKTTVSDAGFECPGVQVIGYLGTVPPAAPFYSLKK